VEENKNMTKKQKETQENNVVVWPRCCIALKAVGGVFPYEWL
jgi:hypothetical protein